MSYRTVLFYGCISSLNLAVVGMFLIVNTPPPALAVYHPPVYHFVPKVIIQGEPVRIIVPSVGIDLSVHRGVYNPTDNTWSLNSTSAFYANASVPANNNNGITLIYAHGQAGLFGSLPTVQPGASAQVHTSSGAVFSYTYASSQQVDPNNTDIFAINTLPTLVLQTCTGDWSQYRGLYSFHLTAVTSP